MMPENWSYLKILIIIMAILLSVSWVGFARSSKNIVNIDYVSLGDSLAAGTTPNNITDKSYTDFIAEKLKSEGVLGDYKNFGVPGYTTNDIYTNIDPTNPENFQRVTAISQAEIITLDVGANDLLNIIPVLIEDPVHAPAIIQNTAENLTKITYTLQDINPKAKIYLMGYYNAFPYYPQEQQTQLIPLIKKFNLAIENTAVLTGATYIDTYSVMDMNLKKYLPENNIHPNLSGYQAIAKEFWSVIETDLLR